MTTRSHRPLGSRHTGVTIAALALVALGHPALGAHPIERVVAVVNDDIILDTELEQWAAPFYRGPEIETDAGKREWEQHKRKTLDQLIDSKLIQQQANELKINVGVDEIDRAIDEVKRQNNLDDTAFRDALKQQGFTFEAYRKNLRKQILELKVINTAVRARVTVSDDEVRAAYQQSERTLGGDRQSHLRQILFAVGAEASRDEVERRRRVAQKVVDLARAGTSFVELAKQYSDDEISKGAGGDLGWLGKGSLVEELEDALTSMEPGDIRGPLRTARGWMVLQLVERKAGDMRPLEEVKDQLRKQLYDQQVEKATKAWLKELRKKSHVDVRL